MSGPNKGKKINKRKLLQASVLVSIRRNFNLMTQQIIIKCQKWHISTSVCCKLNKKNYR